MGKRLLSVNPRSETILNYMKENGKTISSFVDEAILNNLLPIFCPTLRTEALYLLDIVTDGGKQWTGNKIHVFTENGLQDIAIAEPQYVVTQALGRSVAYLKNHHIKNKQPFEYIMNYYHHASFSGGVLLSELDEYQNLIIEKVRKKLKEIDSNYHEYWIGLGQLAKDILKNWDALWDWDFSYEVLSMIIYVEKRQKDIPLLEAVALLQLMETVLISEYVK